MLYYTNKSGGKFTGMSARKDLLVAGGGGLILESFSVQLHVLDLECSRLSMLWVCAIPVLAGVNRFFPPLNHGAKEHCMLLQLLI